MTLTPLQIDAYIELIEKLGRMKQANDLMITFVGSQGDSKAIEKTLKELGA